MKAFLLAIVAAAVIAVAWASVLNKVQEPVSEAGPAVGPGSGTAGVVCAFFR